MPRLKRQRPPPEKIKVYASSTSPAPDGWRQAKTVAAVTAFVTDGTVSHLSLERDFGKKWAGHEFLRTLQRVLIHQSQVPIPELLVHETDPEKAQELDRLVSSVKSLQVSAAEWREATKKRFESPEAMARLRKIGNEHARVLEEQRAAEHSEWGRDFIERHPDASDKLIATFKEAWPEAAKILEKHRAERQSGA